MKALPVLLMLVGCSQYNQEAMTNDAIIAETKKCESAGLKAVPFSLGLGGYVVQIQCAPRREVEK